MSRFQNAITKICKPINFVPILTIVSDLIFVQMYPIAHYNNFFINFFFLSSPSWIGILLKIQNSTADFLPFLSVIFSILNSRRYFGQNMHWALCVSSPFNRNYSAPEVKLRRRYGSRTEQPILNRADQWDQPIAHSVTGAIDVEDASN